MSNSLYGARAVKSSARAYLVGRGLSAVLTFSAFALAARSMAVSDYGAYMLALATMELGLALATFGLDWVANRYLPEYRMHASGRRTVRFILGLGGGQLSLLVLIGAAVWFGNTHLSALSGLTGDPALFTFAAVLVVTEGAGRLMRDQFLGILMLQWQGQLAQILRAATLTGLFAWSVANGEQLSIDRVLAFEIVSAVVALCAGAFSLILALLRLAPIPARDDTWTPAGLREMSRLAAHMYASYLLALAYGPQVITFIVSRLLGSEAVAVYGFARTFADQVRRYLPTDMLQSVVRPALVAHYSRERDFADLSVRLRLWFKSALWMLAPIIIFFFALRSDASRLIGGEGYRDAWPLLAVLLLGTAAMAFRRVAELAATMVRAPELCARAALLLLGVPLLIWAVLAITRDVLWAGLVVSTSELVFCAVLARMIAARGHRADSDGRWVRWGVALTVTLLFTSLATRIDSVAALLVLALTWGGFLLRGGLLSQAERTIVRAASHRLASCIN